MNLRLSLSLANWNREFSLLHDFNDEYENFWLFSAILNVCLYICSGLILYDHSVITIKMVEFRVRLSNHYCMLEVHIRAFFISRASFCEKTVVAYTLISKLFVAKIFTATAKISLSLALYKCSRSRFWVYSCAKQLRVAFQVVLCARLSFHYL